MASVTADKLSIYTSPVLTLSLFSQVLAEYVRDGLVFFIKHKVTHFLLLPLLVIYLIANNIEGDHQHYVSLLEWSVEFFVWWFGLGVLSSIGLGTGMHTGVLFLFPHVFKVCLAAANCQSTNFSSLNDIWFRTDNNFICLDSEEPHQEVGFVDILLKVIWPCFIWGAGTALGEVPPYWVSRAAALAGEKNAEFEEATEANSKWNIINVMKNWMIDFLKKHGFLGVLLMSAWPNMAFDLCGICCGHFLMPFWQFLGATFIGKALIKSTSQACFFIMLFTPKYLESFVSFVESIIPDKYDPCMWIKNTECHVLLHDLLSKIGTDFQKKIDKTGGTDSDVSVLKMIWGWFMVILIGYFVLSCIEQFAKYRLNQLEKREKKKSK